jgi:hypothetical protein
MTLEALLGAVLARWSGSFGCFFGRAEGRTDGAVLTRLTTLSVAPEALLALEREACDSFLAV